MLQGGFTRDSPLVTWFWEFLRECSPPQRGLVLRFATGTRRMPLDGFEPPFNLTSNADMDPSSLPKAHTCFNQLDLPEYSNEKTLEEKLLLAIREGSQGFAMA